jgi:tellurium resistance protein TerZ
MSQVFSLAQNDKVVLEKANASAMDHFAVGMNWSAIQKGGKLGFLAGKILGDSVKAALQDGIDFDVSVVCIDKDGAVGEYVTATKHSNINNSIKHSGDDDSGDAGEDDGADNEIVNMELSKVPDNVQSLFMTLTIASNHTLDKAPSAMARIYDTHRTTNDTKSNMHFAEFGISGNNKYNGMKGLILAKVSRTPADPKKWELTIIDQPNASDSLRVLANICSSL